MGSSVSTASARSLRLVCPAPTTRRVPTVTDAQVRAPRKRVGGGPCTIMTSASAESSDTTVSAFPMLNPRSATRGTTSSSAGDARSEKRSNVIPAASTGRTA